MFGVLSLTKDEVEGRRVIEFGSCAINGTLRPFVESLHPVEYIGIDIEKGPNVDIICDAEDVLDKFGRESFDIVISTELLEHVKNWRKVISNMKNVCKPNGLILVTTRSYGFPYHAYPYDFWRYEPVDMQHVFSDCDIERLEKDKETPGVLIKARKPHEFVEADLAGYELYSIIANKRIKEIDKKIFTHSRILRQQLLRQKIKKSLYLHIRDMLETII